MIAASELNRGRDVAMCLPREMMDRSFETRNCNHVFPMEQVPSQAP